MRIMANSLYDCQKSTNCNKRRKIRATNGDVDNLDVYTLQEPIDKIQYKENVTEGDEKFRRDNRGF